MSLDRTNSDCNFKDIPNAMSNECILQKRSLKHRKIDQIVPRMYSGDEIEILRLQLENETKNRNEAQCKYTDLRHQLEVFGCSIEDSKKNPDSKYDALIHKQNCINDTMNIQLNEARDKLASLTHSLKSIQVCGKECNLNSKDLILNYDCMSKNEILKEIKKFERMQIDLKSNLDRLQFKIDHESKEYYNLMDQFQKLQIELYYLQNLNDKYTMRGLW